MSDPDPIDAFMDLPLHEQLGRLVNARLDYHREYGKYGRWPDHPGDEHISSLTFIARHFADPDLRQRSEPGYPYGQSSHVDLHIDCDVTEYGSQHALLRSNCRQALVAVDFVFIEREGEQRCHLITGGGPHFLLYLMSLTHALRTAFKHVRCSTYWEPPWTTMKYRDVDGSLTRLSGFLGLEIARQRATAAYPYRQPDGSSRGREITVMAVGIELS